MTGSQQAGPLRAALQALSRSRPAYLVLAVPVAPADTLEQLRSQVDEIVCLITPEPFYAVGLYYDDVTQTSDAEVITLLHEAQTWSREAAQ